MTSFLLIPFLFHYFIDKITLISVGQIILPSWKLFNVYHISHAQFVYLRACHDGESSIQQPPNLRTGSRLIGGALQIWRQAHVPTVSLLRELEACSQTNNVPASCVCFLASVCLVFLALKRYHCRFVEVLNNCLKQHRHAINKGFKSSPKVGKIDF